VFQKVNARITGRSPLLMHSGQMINTRNEYARAMKAVTSKRMKTDADHEEMARIEWTAGLYLRGGKIAIPSEVVEAALVGAAKKSKSGKQAQAGLFVENDAPLIFPGADQSVEALWKNGAYTFSVPVRVSSARVIRTRPRFDEWAADLSVVYDDGLFNRQAVIDILHICGDQIGIGDWRPKFGRFTVEIGA